MVNFVKITDERTLVDLLDSLSFSDSSDCVFVKFVGEEKHERDGEDDPV